MGDTETYEKYAKQWFTAVRRKKWEAKDRYTKVLANYENFLLCWLSLVFLMKADSTNVGGERKRIPVFVNNLDSSVVDDIIKCQSKNINELNALKVENMNPQRKYPDGTPITRTSDYTRLANSLNSSPPDNQEILQKTLVLIYVVRCNLFHGDKTWTLQRDKTIMFFASTILKGILSSIFDYKGKQK